MTYYCVLNDDLKTNLNSSNKRCTIVYKLNLNLKLNEIEQKSNRP